MNDDIKGLRDDIAFMRALAEEGRAPPQLGGVVLVTAGAVFALASLGHWAIAVGLVAASPATYAVIWLVAVTIFMIVLFASVPRMKAMPGARSTGNRAMSMVWAGLGWGCFTLMLSIGVVSWRTHSAVPLMLIPSFILTLYGVAWSVSAAVSRRRWLWATAIGSYLSALVMALVSDRPEVYLIYAVALILLVGLPGLVLMRQEPSRAS